MVGYNLLMTNQMMMLRQEYGSERPAWATKQVYFVFLMKGNMILLETN